MFLCPDSPLTGVVSRGSLVKYSMAAAGLVFTEAKAREKPGRGLWGTTLTHLLLVCRAPEMAVKPRHAPKAKPAFCTGVPQHTVLGKARPHAAD